MQSLGDVTVTFRERRLNAINLFYTTASFNPVARVNWSEFELVAYFE